MGLEEELKTAYRFAPRVILIVAVLFMLVNFSWMSIVFFCGIIAAEVLTLGFKKMSPKNFKWTYRPEGAENCGVVPTGSPSSCSKGTVSGHSAVASFAATFWILSILSEEDKISTRQALQASALGFVTLTILASRLLFNCHTKIQVVLGCGLGVGLGFLGRHAHRILEERGPVQLRGTTPGTCPRV